MGLWKPIIISKYAFHEKGAFAVDFYSNCNASALMPRIGGYSLG